MIVFPETFVFLSIRVPKRAKALFMALTQLPRIDFPRLEQVSPVSLHQIIDPVAEVQVFRRKYIYPDSMSFQGVALVVFRNLLLEFLLFCLSLRINNFPKVETIITILFADPILVDYQVWQLVQYQLLQTGPRLPVLQT